MTLDAAALAGAACCAVYEKEVFHDTRYLETLSFYLDGRIRFERYCFGEAACLVVGLWASGLDENGVLVWEDPPRFESQRHPLPCQLREIQQEGKALLFDEDQCRYLFKETKDSDKANGYSKWKLFWLRKKLSK